MIFSTVAKLHWDCIEAVKARLETALAADSASNDQSTYSLWCGVAGHHRKQVRKIRSSARANFAHRFYILYVCNYIHTLLFGEAYPCFASSLGLFLSCTTQKNRGCCYATDSSELYSGCCCCYIDRRRVVKKRPRPCWQQREVSCWPGSPLGGHLFCAGVIGKG